MIELPSAFIAQMRSMLGAEADEFFKIYAAPSVYRAIRINPLKISAQEFKAISPFALTPVPWEENGFFVSDEKPGKHIFHAAGLYYVQEPSAMCAAPMLGVKEGERVLDLCSAPGGKGTRLAQSTNGVGTVVLNEINYSRARVLSQNVERLGIKNAVVTCASPSDLSKIFAGYFDKILVDAPCSGEGMFRKEEAAVRDWSEENVRACAIRQQAILASAIKMLKRGGRLVYSTCTFNTHENEEQIERAVNAGGVKLITQKKLLPHEMQGEGHFAALLEKTEEEDCEVTPFKPVFTNKLRLKAYREFERETLKISFDRLHAVGDTLYSIPQDMPEIPVSILRAGVCLGEFKGDRFVPSHSLAICLKNGEVKTVEVDERQALDYLAGRTFSCDEKLSGWYAVTFNGFPLGWCKAVGGTAKNHLPKGLRI